MFELFHEPKIDFMKYKWLWIGMTTRAAAVRTSESEIQNHFQPMKL